MSIKRIIHLLLFIALLLPLAGCGAGKPKGKPVIVYVAAPLSGFQANGGQTVVGGARLAAAELNRAHGILGRPVQIVPLDDESDDDAAVAAAQQVTAAVQAGKPVLGVIGHYNSGQTLAAMAVYKDLSLVVITPTASELSLTHRGYRNFFRINANDGVQAKVDAAFLVQKLGAKNVAILHNDTPYGIGLATEITKALRPLGARVALQIQVKEGQGKYDREVTQVQASAADAIFYAGYEIEAPYLRAALVDAGVKLPFLASDGAFLAATIDNADGKADGIYLSAFAPSPKAVATTAWISRYQAVEYRNPDTYSVNGYVAMQVLAAAAEKAKSIRSDQVIAALHQLKMQTMLGEVQYDANGDLRNPMIYIFQVRSDRFVQVQP